MTVRIAIDRLVIDGLALNARERAVLAGTLRAELSRLATRDGIAAAAYATDRVDVPPIAIADPRDAAGIGTQIAARVHAGIAGGAR